MYIIINTKSHSHQEYHFCYLYNPQYQMQIHPHLLFLTTHIYDIFFGWCMLSAKLLKDGSVKISILQFAGSYPQSHAGCIDDTSLFCTNLSCPFLLSSQFFNLSYFFLNLLFSSLFVFCSWFCLQYAQCMNCTCTASDTYMYFLVPLLFLQVVLELNSIINLCE